MLDGFNTNPCRCHTVNALAVHGPNEYAICTCYYWLIYDHTDRKQSVDPCRERILYAMANNTI